MGSIELNGLYVRRCGTFLPVHDVERHALVFVQNLESVTLDGAVMNKHILAVIAGDKAEALCLVEPLDRTLLHSGTPFFCFFLKMEPLQTGVYEMPKIKWFSSYFGLFASNLYCAPPASCRDCTFQVADYIPFFPVVKLFFRHRHFGDPTNEILLSMVSTGICWRTQLKPPLSVKRTSPKGRLAVKETPVTQRVSSSVALTQIRW